MNIAESNPLTGMAPTLRRAVCTVFANRPEVTALAFDGPEAQAWIAYARVLAMAPVELANALAPALGVESAGNLRGAAFEPSVLAQVPFNFCQSHNVLPVR